jgi:hypothetical protein
MNIREARWVAIKFRAFQTYIYCIIALLWPSFVNDKTSLSGDFMSLFPIYLDFGNSAEEFHSHENLSTFMKLLLSLSSLI